MGSVADYLEVDRSYERAVEACLGECAAARRRRARTLTRLPACGWPASAMPAASGFVVAERATRSRGGAGGDRRAAGTDAARRSRARVRPGRATVIRAVLAHAWVAPDFDSGPRRRARWSRARSSRSRATSSAAPTSSRAASAPKPRASSTTKREIKELRERADEAARGSRSRARGALRDRPADRRRGVGDGCRCRASSIGRRRPMVGFDLQIGAAGDAAERIARKREQIAVERRYCRGRAADAGRAAGRGAGSRSPGSKPISARPTTS